MNKEVYLFDVAEVEDGKGDGRTLDCVSKQQFFEVLIKLVFCWPLLDYDSENVEHNL